MVNFTHRIGKRWTVDYCEVSYGAQPSVRIKFDALGVAIGDDPDKVVQELFDYLQIADNGKKEQQ